MESARGAPARRRRQHLHRLHQLLGPQILGHAHPPVIDAVKRAAEKGTSFGTPTELETQIAELICEMVPYIDQIRMVNSGTEACMSAIRLARGFTGREKIVKFAGCYHGHSDAFLIQAGSGASRLAHPVRPESPKAQRKTPCSPLTTTSAPSRRCSMNTTVKWQPSSLNPLQATWDASRHNRIFGRVESRLRRARHAAHLRRSHDRIPAGGRWRGRGLWRHARHGVLRQGHRRRTPCGGVCSPP